MPLVPVSLVVHVALASFLSVGWAILALLLFQLRYAAARRLVLASAVLLPVASSKAHAVTTPPLGCTEPHYLTSYGLKSFTAITYQATGAM